MLVHTLRGDFPLARLAERGYAARCGSWQIAVTCDPPAVPGIQEEHRPAAPFKRNLTLGRCCTYGVKQEKS
jgi:hypothetical protein